MCVTIWLSKNCRICSFRPSRHTRKRRRDARPQLPIQPQHTAFRGVIVSEESTKQKKLQVCSSQTCRCTIHQRFVIGCAKKIAIARRAAPALQTIYVDTFATSAPGRTPQKQAGPSTHTHSGRPSKAPHSGHPHAIPLRASKLNCGFHGAVT